jgi:hypothetical protein
MRKSLNRLSALLAAGAIINLGVAWCAELWQPFELKFQADRCGNLPGKDGRTLTWIVDSQFGIDRMRWLVGSAVPRPGDSKAQTRRPPGWSTLLFRSEFTDPTSLSILSSHWYEQAAGWPMRSMRGCVEYRAGGPPARISSTPAFGATAPPVTVRVEHGAEVFKDGAGGHLPMISLVPIATGFLVNTLCFATSLAMLVMTWKAISSRFRRRAGVCPVCKYDLRGMAHERCPECGTEVRDRAQASI